MKLVTGGAGFIGSHLVDALVARGEPVRVLDNFTTGHRAFLEPQVRARQVQVQRGDVFRAADLARALRDVDEVYHLAADPDVRRGIRYPWENFRDGAVATFHVLDAMRRKDVPRIVFTSSSVVYGEAKKLPTPEDYGPCLPISPYGASKLAAEGLIAAFAGTYGAQAWIYRFGNVVGPRLTHGVLHDFAAQLRKDPTRLTVLGDGTQEKSYLSTVDCIEGMLLGRDYGRDRINVFNLASLTATKVRRIADLLLEAFGVRNARIEYTGGDRGWPGDVRKMRLDVSRLIDLGWNPRHSSDDAVERTAQWLAAEARPSSSRKTLGRARAGRVK